MGYQQTENIKLRKGKAKKGDGAVLRARVL